MAFQPPILAFLRPWLLATIAAFAAAPRLCPEAEPGSGAYALLAYAVAAWSSGYLLYPAQGLAPLPAVMGWSLAAALGAVAYGWALAPPVPVQSLLLLGCALAVALASLLLVRRALARALPETSARAVAALLAAICAAAPVWLGPWVERADGAAWWVDPALGISPLTYFAVALDCDYLRESWFYEHTPFGAYRYAYPGFMALTLAYACLGAAAWGIARGRSPRLSGTEFQTASP